MSHSAGAADPRASDPWVEMPEWLIEKIVQDAMAMIVDHADPSEVLSADAARLLRDFLQEETERSNHQEIHHQEHAPHDP